MSPAPAEGDAKPARQFFAFWPLRAQVFGEKDRDQEIECLFIGRCGVVHGNILRHQFVQENNWLNPCPDFREKRIQPRTLVSEPWTWYGDTTMLAKLTRTVRAHIVERCLLDPMARRGVMNEPSVLKRRRAASLRPHAYDAVGYEIFELPLWQVPPRYLAHYAMHRLHPDPDRLANRYAANQDEETLFYRMLPPCRSKVEWAARIGPEVFEDFAAEVAGEVSGERWIGKGTRGFLSKKLAHFVAQGEIASEVADELVEELFQNETRGGRWGRSAEMGPFTCSSQHSD